MRVHPHFPKMRGFVTLSHAHARAPRSLAAGTLLLATLLGCSSDSVGPYQPATGDAAAGLYWSLTLDHEALTLSTVAPYDTIRLTATPRDANGKPLVGLGPVTYTSSDPTRVQVTPDGLVRALDIAFGVSIKAELTAGEVRHADQLYVMVTNNPSPPVLTRLSAEPLAPDSTIWAVGGEGAFFQVRADGSYTTTGAKLLTVHGAFDQADQPINDLMINYTSSDSTVMTAIGEGSVVLIDAQRPGRASVIANATAYGVTRADTVEFTIRMPLAVAVRIKGKSTSTGGVTAPLFEPAEVTVSPGGTIVWANVSGEPVDIVFDDPASAVEHGAVSCAAAGVVDVGGQGNVEAFGEPQAPDATMLSAANCRSRRFLTAGVYPYRSAQTGATGRIVVTDDLSASGTR